MIPGSVFLYTSTGRRTLTFALAEKDVAFFVAPVPAHPGEEFEQWSEWLSGPKESAFSYRFRVKRTIEEQSELDFRSRAAGEARRQAFAQLQPRESLDKWLPFLYAEGNPYSQTSAPMAEQAGEVIRQRWKEVPNLLDAVSPEMTIPALLAVQALNDVPESFVGPLQHVAGGIASRLRGFRQSLDPLDPDLDSAEKIKQSYVLWRTAWERAAANRRLPPPAQLAAIESEATQITGISEITTIASQAKTDFALWSESAKQ